MTAAKKNAKATKKFEKKHLKGALERRKAVATIKQRQQVKAKKQSKRTKDSEFYKGGEENGSTPKPKGHSATKNVNDMSVDDFFQSGFEILDKGKKGKKTSGKLGKRKRDQPERAGDQGPDGGSDVDMSEEGAPQVDGSDDDDDDDNVGMNQAAMDALAKDDPEFYKFLQENDPDALQFDDDDEALAGIDELSEGEGEEQPKKKRKKGKKQSDESDAEDEDELDEESEDEFAPKKNELTRHTVAGWKKSLTQTHSLRTARQVVIAFRCAAHLNEPDDEKKDQPFSILDPEVFHDVLVVALKQVPDVLEHHVPVKETASGHVKLPSDAKKFTTLAPLIKSFTTNLLHLLGTLSDEATLKLTISSLQPMLPYLLNFRVLLKAVIKRVVGFWSQPSSTESTRITAFLVLRRLLVVGDKAVREAVLKAAYQGLIQGCRTTNPNTIAGINLMKNSAAELWGIDQGAGYTTAFTFIRKLAIHLRNSIVQKQKNSHTAIYNWQYVHSLDFWSCVLSEHCSARKQAEVGKESQLKLLIYPLVQVTLGAMRLIPTATYFPLRFHLIHSLLRLSRATGTFVPLASALLEVLNSADMKKAPKAASLKPFDFAVGYKVPKSYLRSRIYQDGLGEQVVELFAEYFVLWATNIAFPEFALPVIVMLKRWLKDVRRKGSGNKNGKLVTSLVLLVQKLEANAAFVEERRAKVDFAPRDRAQVDAFLRDFDVDKTPVGAFMVTQRRAIAERARMLEEARRDDQRRAQEAKKESRRGAGPSKDDEDDEEGGEDGEDLDLGDSEEEGEEEEEEEEDLEQEDEDEDEEDF